MVAEEVVDHQNPARVPLPYWRWTPLVRGEDCFWDCCFWLLLRSICLLVGTPVRQSNRSAALNSRLLDEAIPRMDITPALSQNVVSKIGVSWGTRHLSIEVRCWQGRRTPVLDSCC